MSAEDELPLPGLASPALPTGEVEAAARLTLAALAPDLDDRHAVMAQALVTVARQLDRAAGSRSAKDYGVAQLVGQLRDTYAVLAPETDGEGESDAWDELANDLRSAAVVRNAAQSGSTL